MTPLITFDQLLFWKAMLIVASDPTGNDIKVVFIRLGGLYVEINFIGCVCYLMVETGLAQILKVVYARNSVKHILSGNYFVGPSEDTI